MAVAESIGRKLEELRRRREEGIARIHGEQVPKLPKTQAAPEVPPGVAPSPIVPEEAPKVPELVGPLRPRGMRMEGPAGQAGVFRDLTDEGVRYDAGTAGTMAGRGVGGGTLGTMPGRTLEQLQADLAAQRDLTAVRKAQQYYDLPKGQRGRRPDVVSDVMGLARAPKLSRTSGGGTGGDLADAFDDYAAGRVGTPGYSKIASMMLRQRSDMRDIARLGTQRERAAAMRAYRSPFEQLARPARAGTTGASSVGDYINFARLQRDVRRDSAADRQQQLENALALRGELREDQATRLARAEAERKGEAHTASMEDRFREWAGQRAVIPEAREQFTQAAWDISRLTGVSPQQVFLALQVQLGKAQKSAEGGLFGGGFDPSPENIERIILDVAEGLQQ